MRTTLSIDEKILRKASRLTGITEKTSLVRSGLEALIARENGKKARRARRDPAVAPAHSKKKTLGKIVHRETDQSDLRRSHAFPLL